MPSIGNTVLANDVNDPLGVGVAVMGTGSLSRGYGQTTFGTGVAVGGVIGANDFNNMRYDLLNASAHQNGTAAALSLAGNTPGSIINVTDANNFASYANTIDSNRFSAHISRMSTISYGGGSRTSSWVASVSATYQLNFSNANTARHFWNAGGRIRISSSRSGGAATSQNSSWSNLLSGAGWQEFGGIGVYSWSTSSTRLYAATASGAYSSNTYSIDVSTNANWPSATSFNFTLIWSDPYVDPSPGHPPAPDDIVDGTLSYSVEITYPTGGAALSPSGTWVSYAPSSYSSPNISGS